MVHEAEGVNELGEAFRTAIECQSKIGFRPAAHRPIETGKLFLD
jgi:hypothetical protein